MAEASFKLDDLDLPIELRRLKRKPSGPCSYDPQLNILFRQLKAIRAELSELEQQIADLRISGQWPKRGRGRPRGSGHAAIEVYSDYMQAQLEPRSRNRSVEFVAKVRKLSERHVRRLIRVDRNLLAAFLTSV